MKKKFWIAGALVLVAAVIIVLFLLPTGGQERPATVVEAVNKVDAHPRPQDDWQPAVVGMDIYGGGQVRTGIESSARLELLEGMVRLSAESIFTVRESTTRQGRLMTTLFLESGRLWAHLTTGQPHEFTVETGSAIAAVRDTRFSVRFTAGETFLSVAEGWAVLTAQEQSVTVAAGEQTIVKPGQPPAPPEPMSDDERRLWAIEGEMPELAPPAPTRKSTPTSTPVGVGDPFVDRVVAFSQGSPGWEEFSDPSAILGAPDMSAEPPYSGFVNLGIGGQITLEFVDNAAVDGPGPDILVAGDTWNDELLIVEVSADGVIYKSFGLTSEIAELDLADVGLSYAKFIRITDDGSTEQEGEESAGSELDAVQALNSGPPKKETPLPTKTPIHRPSPMAKPTATPTLTKTPIHRPSPMAKPTATPTLTKTPTRTPRPTTTPTNTPVKVSLWCDVNSFLTGPAGDPASRGPQTVFMGGIQSGTAAQVVVELPSGESVVLPFGDVFEWEPGFLGSIQGLPQPGGTYTFTALDADGTPIAGAVASDVYIGGYDLDPPANVQAKVVESGILVTWDPPPTIPGAFNPGGSPPVGHYHIPLNREGREKVYSWAGPERSHLIPFHHRDFGPGDVGLALEELGDGVYSLTIHAASWAPEGAAGHGIECQVFDPEEEVRFVIQGGQVRIERP